MGILSLVGGFNPFEKYESKWESSPNRGENKKYLSCHQLETFTIRPIPTLLFQFEISTKGFGNPSIIVTKQWKAQVQAFRLPQDFFGVMKKDELVVEPIHLKYIYQIGWWWKMRNLKTCVSLSL